MLLLKTVVLNFCSGKLFSFAINFKDSFDFLEEERVVKSYL